MVRILCIASLALAAVSAVSGHILRHRKNPPQGWETDILQPYHQYHDRYLTWGCQNKHNTTFFKNCCHPLLKGESIDALDNSNYDCDCEADDSSVPSSSVPSSSPQPVYKTPVPETSSTPSSAPAPTSSSAKFRKVVAPASPSVSPTSAPATTTTSVAAPPPSSTPSNNGGNGGNGNDNGNGGDGSEHTGGFATYFYQGGAAGACGTVHQDTDFICALDSALYGKDGNASKHCNSKVVITNTQNQKTITVTVADDCPTCRNENSIDLSVAAFQALTDNNLGLGEFPIVWKFA